MAPTLTAHAILALQRTAGHQAVTRILARQDEFESENLAGQEA